MAKNKVVYNGTTLIDLTDTTATASDVASGKYFYTNAGVRTEGTASSSGGLAVQVCSGYASVNSTSYTATSISVTVAKAGTYKCSWIGWRSNGSGTFGSRLYKNGSAVGSEHTTFTRSYGQSCSETLTLAANDVIVVRAKSRGSSYYMLVGNLILEQTS